MGWTKSEWKRIRDGESWGDVWMTRNPEYILESAEKMVKEIEIKEKEEKEKSKKKE